MAVNTNTRTYGTDGKPLEEVTGEPKIEIPVLDTLDRLSVTVKAIGSALEEQITKALKSRQYIYVGLLTLSRLLMRGGFYSLRIPRINPHIMWRTMGIFDKVIQALFDGTIKRHSAAHRKAGD